MTNKERTKEKMKEQEQRTYLETQRIMLNASGYPYSKEDFDKLYDKYGPYTPDVINMAVSNPNGLNHPGAPFIPLTTKDYLDNLIEKDVDYGQLSYSLGKPEGEIRNNIAKYHQRKEEEQQVDQTYQEICGGKPKSKVSVNDLLAAGVTQEDIQAVFGNNPEMLSQIGGGPTCRALAASANDVETRYKKNPKTGKTEAQTGRCKAGVDDIYTNARRKYDLPSDSIHTKEALRAMDQDRRAHPYQKESRGGCNVDEGLLASGDYIEIKVKNTAYLKPGSSRENREMNDLISGVQPGITISVDSIEDRKKKQAGTAGGTYGHTAVKRSKGKDWSCDFEQGSINFSRYGEYIHVCVPKDAEIPEEYAKLLIAQAQERTGQCLNVKENQAQKRQQTATSMKSDSRKARGRVASTKARNKKSKKRKSTTKTSQKKKQSKKRTTSRYTRQNGGR